MTVINEDFEQSFNELKSGLKDKYNSILYSHIDQAKTSVNQELTALLGSDFLSLLDQTKQLQEQIAKETADFHSSHDYKSKIDDLARLTKELPNASEEEKTELKKEIAKALSAVTTLNITIRNRLKDKREVLKQNKLPKGK